jgi:5'-3' exonuclease
MGVPKLFHSLIQQYHNDPVSNPTGYYIIQKDLGNDLPVHLYFDFNSAIYQVITPEIKTEATLIIYTVQYLETLCSIIPNLELIYIALDGVVNLAKQVQQRQRRFHSVCRNNRMRKINEIYGTATDKSNINTIDTNMITPGTEFMYNLGLAIRKAIVESESKGGVFSGKTVIFNDSSIPGEGEHKIIHHIRENKKTKETKETKDIEDAHNTVIYALDNDLIMLSLTLGIERMFLFREATEYGNFASIHTGKRYLFMNINELENALIHNFQDTYGCTKIETIEARKRHIDDYVFLGMLLGNDFMPKTHWFSIAEGGYERLLSSYWQIYNHTELFLVSSSSMTINTEMLSDLLYLVKEQEQVAIESLFQKRRKSRVHVKEDMTERERQQLITDFYPLQYLHVEKVIDPIKDGWRDRYYKICFNLEARSENVKMITQSYIKTLVWNFHYYFNECISWDWVYNFPYAPTWNDIYNELLEHKNINISSSDKLFHFGNTKPIDSQTLLLMVLPWASRKFMASDIVKKLEQNNCPMHIYFPKKYSLNVAFNRFYHECTPIIYKIELSKVERFISTCKLNENELKRNIIGNVFIKKN